jgi:anti-anti-sigma factor
MQQSSVLDIHDVNGVSVVVFNTANICDIPAINAISRDLKDFIGKVHPRKIVIDFMQVKFFTSQTLGLLLDIWRKLQSSNGQIVISGINPQLHRVFRITNLDKIFKFFPDQDSALKAFESTEGVKEP